MKMKIAVSACLMGDVKVPGTFTKDLSGSGIMGSSPVDASVKRSPYAGIFSDVKNTYHSCEIKRLQRNS